MPVAIENKNTYGISAANMLDRRSVHMALSWRAEDYVTLARDGEHEGFEIWPIRPQLALQIISGEIPASAKSSILSAHQSPREERIFSDVKRDPRKAQALIIPGIPESLVHIQRIRESVGDIPVIFSNQTPKEFHEKSHITNRLIQPDPETCRIWGVKSPRDFLEKMEEHGLTGICFPLTHIRRPHPRQMPDVESPLKWEEALPLFIDSRKMKELHVEVGRTDPATANIIGREKTIAEARDLIEGTEKTEAVQMLHMIAERGWRGLVIVEILPEAIMDVMGLKGHFIRREELVAAYKAIRESLYQIFKQ